MNYHGTLEPIALAVLDRAPAGFSESGFFVFRKDSKLVAILAPHWVGVGRTQIFAFPSAAHLGDFKRALRLTKVASPGQNHPGSIGGLRLDLIGRPDTKPGIFLPSTYAGDVRSFLDVEFVQASYRKKDPETMSAEDLSKALDARLHDRYHGWRRRCLELALYRSKQTGTPLLVQKGNREMRHFFNEPGRDTFVTELRSVARHWRAPVHENGHYIVIGPARKHFRLSALRHPLRYD